MQTDITNQANVKSAARPIKLNELSGPAGVPLLGNLHQLTPAKLHRIIGRWSDRYGPIFKINLAKIPVVIITGPEAVQHVLKNRPEKFRRMSKMDEIIREMGITGVFNAEGEDWKRQRKMVSQALNVHHIKNFFPAMVRITEKLLNWWSSLSAGNASIEIKSELMRYTVDITSELAFGYEMNTIEKREHAIQNHLEVIFPAIFKRVNLPIPYWRYIKLPSDRKLEKSLDVIYKTMQAIIDKTREQLHEDPALNLHPTNFLQALIAASTQEDPVSNQVIIGNVLTMLLAGEDTTAHTMAWIFYFMHLFPEVQQKIRQEADTVLGNHTHLKKYEDAEKLHYTEAVAFEAMRLKPVAPVLFHDTLEDVVIDGVEIPKGTGIFLHSHHAAIMEAHFSFAEAFIPERWMEGGCPAHKAHNERAFMPFGAGPRFCPGYNLAMLEIKAVLAMVCKNFFITMETVPEKVHEKLAFTMMPSDFFIKLERRGGS